MRGICFQQHLCGTSQHRLIQLSCFVALISALLVVLGLHQTVSASMALAGDHRACYQKIIQSERRLSSQNVEHYLDCISWKPRDLSLLAAQWLVLKKAHWSLSESSNHRQRHQFSLEFKGEGNPLNVMDPTQSHRVNLPFSLWGSSESDFMQLMRLLEEQVFPQALAGGTATRQNNRTSWSFDASFHHYMAYHDTPLPLWSQWGRKEGAGRYYEGTLLESRNWRSNSWYDQYSEFAPMIRPLDGLSQHETAFKVLRRSHFGTHFWPELRRIYSRDFQECPETACFHRQTRTVVQALLTLLDHPELFEKVHKSRLSGFGPDDQRSVELPRRIGCYGRPGETAAFTEPTGDLYWDFSLTGKEPNFAPDFTQFGVHGIIGRALYVEAIDKSARITGGTAGQFQGQNAIIRDLTPDAVRSLSQLNGLGTTKNREIRNRNGFYFHPGRHIEDVYRSSQDRSRIADMVDDLVGSGVFEQTASQLSASFPMAVERGQGQNHGALSNAFFRQTQVSFGYSLSWWIAYLQRQQPQLRYHIIGYDYMLRARARNRQGVVSYFDRVEEVLKPERNLFARFAL